jgi:hypothetical protein
LIDRDEDASPSKDGALDFDPADMPQEFTLLPVSRPPFILGSRSAFSVWAAALALSRSIYS